jgi:hypothetical protein
VDTPRGPERQADSMQVHPSPSPPRWRWLALVPALFCLSCSGGPKLNPVKGKVLYKGNPIAGAVVVFHLKGADDLKAVPPTGVTRDVPKVETEEGLVLSEEYGTFTLTTGQKEGAPAGEYVVTITWPKPNREEGKMSITPIETSDQLKGAYANPAKGFKVEIKNGDNQLEPFNLK